MNGNITPDGLRKDILWMHSVGIGGFHIFDAASAAVKIIDSLVQHIIIQTVRNRLKQIGLIDFQKGDGKRHDPYYKINYLSVIGYKIVPDSVGDNPPIGSKNAADGVGGSVGDCVGDGVGDAVSDNPPIGSKFAADGAGDPLYPYSNPNVFINTNKGTVKGNANAGAKAGRTERARACAGLVDLGGTFTGTEGLVPLPWDDPGVRR